jgi:hypothetical protein
MNLSLPKKQNGIRNNIGFISKYGAEDGEYGEDQQEDLNVVVSQSRYHHDYGFPRTRKRTASFNKAKENGLSFYLGVTTLCCSSDVIRMMVELSTNN